VVVREETGRLVREKMGREVVIKGERGIKQVWRVMDMIRLRIKNHSLISTHSELMTSNTHLL
jgi:hypothetical protein